MVQISRETDAKSIHKFLTGKDYDVFEIYHFVREDLLDIANDKVEEEIEPEPIGEDDPAENLEEPEETPEEQPDDPAEDLEETEEPEETQEQDSGLETIEDLGELEPIEDPKTKDNTEKEPKKPEGIPSPDDLLKPKRKVIKTA